MDVIRGVRVDGEYVNPYESPGVVVAKFNTAGFIRTNLQTIGEDCFVRQLPPDPSMPRLGTPVLTNSGICFEIWVAKYSQDHPTQTGYSSHTIDIVNRDANTNDHRVSLVQRPFTEAGHLSLHHLHPDAGLGLDGVRSIDSFIYQLVGYGGVALDVRSAFSFCMAIGAAAGVLQALDQALMPSLFSLPAEMPLYRAWHYYVATWRRPHFRFALQRLYEVEAHVDDLAAGLIDRGAAVDTIRQVRTKYPAGDRAVSTDTIQSLGAVHEKIFLIRFLALAYLDGAWE